MQSVDLKEDPMEDNEQHHRRQLHDRWQHNRPQQNIQVLGDHTGLKPGIHPAYRKHRKEGIASSQGHKRNKRNWEHLCQKPPAPVQHFSKIGHRVWLNYMAVH